VQVSLSLYNTRTQSGIKMCGIYASVSKSRSAYPSQDLKSLLYNRGPDHLEESFCKIRTNDGDLNLSFTSTVLALRGGHVTKQPLIDSLTGSILCWNGEAWRIGQNPVKGNDGEAVLSLLAASTHELAKLYSITAVLEVIRSLSGPFAFVYFDKTHEILYFGRDRLGRRSLLINTDDVNATVQFSSLADTTRDTWVEVEADGIYILALSGKLIYPSAESPPEEYFQSSHFDTYRIPWRPEISTSFAVGFNLSNGSDGSLTDRFTLSLELFGCFLQQCSSGRSTCS
jgi:asparagine synthetase B (glutamine-hydrolysing)